MTNVQRMTTSKQQQHQYHLESGVSNVSTVSRVTTYVIMLLLLIVPFRGNPKPSFVYTFSYTLAFTVQLASSWLQQFSDTHMMIIGLSTVCIASFA